MRKIQRNCQMSGGLSLKNMWKRAWYRCSKDERDTTRVCPVNEFHNWLRPYDLITVLIDLNWISLTFSREQGTCISPANGRKVNSQTNGDIVLASLVKDIL